MSRHKNIVAEDQQVQELKQRLLDLFQDATEVTANQLYKASGSKLPFSEWIDKAKAAGVFEPGLTVEERINRLTEKKKEIESRGPRQAYFFGMHPVVASVAAVTVTVLVIYGIATIAAKIKK